MRDRLQGWLQRDGFRWVKIKVGTHPEQDPHRVDMARRGELCSADGSRVLDHCVLGIDHAMTRER